MKRYSTGLVMGILFGLSQVMFASPIPQDNMGGSLSQVKAEEALSAFSVDKQITEQFVSVAASVQGLQKRADHAKESRRKLESQVVVSIEKSAPAIPGVLIAHQGEPNWKERSSDVPGDYNGDGRKDMWDNADKEYDDRWYPDRNSPQDYNRDGREDMWDRIDKEKDDFWKNK